jgi:hypothetical protein
VPDQLRWELKSLLLGIGMTSRQFQEIRQSRKKSIKASWLENRPPTTVRVGTFILMTMLDREFNIVWVNDIAKGLFGPNLIGNKCYNAYHGRDRICEPCVIKQCFEDGKVHQFETDIVAPNGNQMIFSCTASVAAWDEDGRPKMVKERV